MLSIDQINSALIFLVVSYVIIGVLFRDSTASKQQKKRSFLYAFTFIGVLTAVKIFFDSGTISPNYYSVLQIPRNANTLDIRRAYKTLSKTYHPDKNLNNEEYIVLFQQVKVAYDILMDENYRDIYNRFGLLSSFDFDPRKDDLKLLTDVSLTYLFWGVVAYIVTLPTSARACRTWITIVGINQLKSISFILLTQLPHRCRHPVTGGRRPAL